MHLIMEILDRHFIKFTMKCYGLKAVLNDTHHQMALTSVRLNDVSGLGGGHKEFVMDV